MIGLPMMAFGLFVFTMDTLPYQQLKERYAWKWASNSRVGRRPSYQFLGDDEEPLIISGKLRPEITGGDTSLTLLRAMGGQGKVWPLIEGTGALYGYYFIESIDVTREEFFSDGKAASIDFTLNLKRSDVDTIDVLGMITREILELAL